MAFNAGLTKRGKLAALGLMGAVSGYTIPTTLKLAIFSPQTHDCTTTDLAYGTSDELTSSGTGYTAGGYVLSGAAVNLSTNTAQLTFGDVVTGSGTIAASGGETTYEGMIYDTASGNYAYAVFAVTISTGSSSGTMTIDLPADAIALA